MVACSVIKAWQSVVSAVSAVQWSYSIADLHTATQLYALQYIPHQTISVKISTAHATQRYTLKSLTPKLGCPRCTLS